jgi:mono/diheme cytochrome c family protein
MKFSTARTTLLAATLAAFAAAAAGIATAAPPQPKPFAAGDPAVGEPIVNKDCIRCHASRFDGDAGKIYVRPGRKVRTPAQLLTQVRMCNTQLGSGYFPEEEEHVAAYLNLHYYKFEP